MVGLCNAWYCSMSCILRTKALNQYKMLVKRFRWRDTSFMCNGCLNKGKGRSPEVVGFAMSK